MRVWRWAGLAGLVGVAGCGGGEAPPLATLGDSASYAVGMNMGASLREVRNEIELDVLIQGLRDVAEGDTTRLTQQDAMRVVQTFAAEVRQRQAEGRAAMADSNVKVGDAFRVENGQRAGVTTTASGLQYEVLTPGDGPRPGATDRVRVHYRGTLIDGREFDSSYRDGSPVTFALNEVIPGWTEGLQLMPAGAKYRIVLPPALAYGAAGAPPDIGPNATLVFEVELLGIER